ncbi:MAG: T9SS type A sorting domain-containing protein [Bacteroidia bacterium]|nr:T9SS type A sorting domain-containing protein [Bacteroidia bacterium]
MKKIILLALFAICTLNLKSQFSIIYENSFRNWQPNQGWVIIDTDTIPSTVGLITKSVTAGIPPSTEIMDYMLGVKSLIGSSNKVFFSPPISLQNKPWAQFYSYKSTGIMFSVWIVTNPNDTTLSGLTDSVSVLNADGFNSINLLPYSNTTIRLAFKMNGINPTAYIDDIRIFEKQNQAFIPDNCFRTYLQSLIPSGFIGDSLDYTSNAVISLRRIIRPNSCIESLEGLQYFVFLKKIDVSNNLVSYFPSNRLPYLDSLIVNNNFISIIPNIPIAKYINYDNNLARNIPDYLNQQCSFLHANNNLIYDCLRCTNRFVIARLLNNVSVYQAGCMYYDLQYTFDNTLPIPNCSQSIGFINGTVYFDQNLNGVLDVTDIRMQNQHLSFFQSSDIITNNNGYYGLSVDSGIVNIDVVQLPNYLQCTNPYNATIGPDENIHHNFRIIATSQYDDIEVTLSNNGTVAANEPLTLMITLINNGTTSNTANTKLPIPSGVNVISSTFGNVIGDTLYWTTSLQPFQSKFNSVVLSVTGLAQNENHTFNVTAETISDMNLINNIASTSVYVSDSVTVNTNFGFPFDPNNKLVSTPIVNPNFNDFLYYNINFENIGTANATHVIVRDKLSFKLNPNTFQFLGSTHPCSVSYATDSIIQFTFYPIVLTPTNLNPDSSHGSLWFRIKPTSPMQNGDTIFNNAKIIFDTQAPITTNLSKVWVDSTRIADFSALNSTHICASDTIKFSDISSGNPISWEWTFYGASQNSSSQKYPKITYDTPGNYDVMLITHWVDHSDTILKHNFITVNSSYNFITTQEICSSETYIWHGTEYSTSGTYTENNTNLNGCDSIYTLNLTVNTIYSIIENHGICEGETYNWHGQSLATTNTYTANYSSISGCDSIYTLNLTVNPVYSFSENHGICDGETYNWHGQSLTTTNTYTANYSSISGCDSIYTLNLTVNPVYSFTENHSICDGETYNWHGSSYSFSGVYNDSLFTINGCDSVYALNLYVNSIDTSLTVLNPTATSNVIGANYQWLNCDNNLAPISGEINQNFTATENGNYAVVITQGICSDTSSCVNITTVGINSQKTDKLSIYPNPVNNELIIEFKGNIEKINFEIKNSIGQVIYNGTLIEKTIVKTTAFATGFYFLKLENGNTFEFKKIVKNN